jgi:hypothetical protein
VTPRSPSTVDSVFALVFGACACARVETIRPFGRRSVDSTVCAVDQRGIGGDYHASMGPIQSRCFSSLVSISALDVDSLGIRLGHVPRTQSHCIHGKCPSGGACRQGHLCIGTPSSESSTSRCRFCFTARQTTSEQEQETTAPKALPVEHQGCTGKIFLPREAHSGHCPLP